MKCMDTIGVSAASHFPSWMVFLRKLNLGILWHKCYSWPGSSYGASEQITVLEGYMWTLEFWLVVNIHFVLCPIAYFIFIRHLVKKKLGGKVTYKIHIQMICGYKYFFFFAGFCLDWMCAPHWFPHFSLKARILLNDNTFQKHQKVGVPWEPLWS